MQNDFVPLPEQYRRPAMDVDAEGGERNAADTPGDDVEAPPAAADVEVASAQAALTELLQAAPTPRILAGARFQITTIFRP